MKYLEWNNAIINHFFNHNNEDTEVILYFSENIIEEIGKANFNDKPEEGFIQDFYKALRFGVNGTGNSDYITRILALHKRSIDGMIRIDNIPFKEPAYLSYFLSFILPFTSGDTNNNYTINNFHDIVKAFFEKNNLCLNYDRNIRYHLGNIDFLWEELNKWLIEKNNFHLGYIDIHEPPQNYKFAGKYLYHVLFRKEQEEKLTQVFDKENILPNDNISKKYIKSLLVKYHKTLRLSHNTRNAINIDNFIGKKILNRAYQYYKNWDGTEYSDLKTDTNRGYSRSKLILCLNFKRLSGKVEFKYLRIFTNKEYPEEFNLTIDSDNEITGIYQDYREYSSPINDVFSSLDNSVELFNEPLRWKFNWLAKDFYIFQRDQIGLNEWVQIPSIKHDTRTILIIFKKNILNKLDENDWISNLQNDCKLYFDGSKTGLDDHWSAIAIQNINKNQHPTINNLQLNNEEAPKISFDRSFYKAGSFFKCKLPEFWVENITQSEAIGAKYSNDEIIFLKPMRNNYRYSFTSEHLERINQEFKLVTNNIESHKNYKIIDFKKRDNDVIETYLPHRNSIGQKTQNELNYVIGTEAFLDRSLINEFRKRQEAATGNSFYNFQNATNYTGSKIYNENLEGNILIHYLSTLGKIKVSDFNQSKFSLLENRDENFKKKANYLKYKLQDLGFIDYDSSDGLIIVNKATLVIKPSQKGTTVILTGARDAQLVSDIIKKSENNSELTVDIQNQKNDLLPQIVYIKFKTNNHNEINKFAKEFNLIFNKNNLYTQYVFGKFFNSIELWQNSIKPVENQIIDLEGGEMFNIQTLRFVGKPENFNKQLTLIKYSNINGYKTIFRLWYLNEVYEIKDQQYGIYLLLYLNKLLYTNDDGIQKLTNVLLYDKLKKYLAVPVNCKLPIHLNLSVSLLNGIKSEIRYFEFEDISYKGFYLIYKNVESVFATNMIASKLKQELILKQINI